MENSFLAEINQRQLRMIRTDLDAFSDLEIHALVSHGYAVARQAIQSASTEVSDRFQITQVPMKRWYPAMRQASATKLTEELKRSGTLRYRLWSWTDIYSYLTVMYIAVAILLVAWVLKWSDIAIFSRRSEINELRAKVSAHEKTIKELEDRELIEKVIEIEDIGRLARILAIAKDSEGIVVEGKYVLFGGIVDTDRSRSHGEPMVTVRQSSKEPGPACDVYLKDWRADNADKLVNRTIVVVGRVEKARWKSSGWEVRDAKLSVVGKSQN
jgi:cell division protein FtsL